MPISDVRPEKGKAGGGDFAGSFLDTALQRGSDMSLDAKVHLLDLRMRSLPIFEKSSFQEFADSQPGLERVLRLLAQSTIDICCSLLLQRTGAVPRSYAALLSSCEKKRILPTGLVRRLSIELLLINNGFDKNDTDEMRLRHEGIRETIRAFRRFREHVKGLIGAE